MDTFRRRSHITVAQNRADQLADLLARVLRSYGSNVRVHDCESCAVDLQIFRREAAALDVDLRRPLPF